MSQHYLGNPQTLFLGQGGRMEHRYLHMRRDFMTWGKGGGWCFNSSSQFAVPKWKASCSQPMGSSRYFKCRNAPCWLRKSYFSFRYWKWVGTALYLNFAGGGKLRRRQTISQLESTSPIPLRTAGSLWKSQNFDSETVKIKATPLQNAKYLLV